MAQLMARSGHVSRGPELGAEESSVDVTTSWDPGPFLISQLRARGRLLGQSQRKHVKLSGEVLTPRLANSRIEDYFLGARMRQTGFHLLSAHLEDRILFVLPQGRCDISACFFVFVGVLFWFWGFFGGFIVAVFIFLS